jgi:hypothetical protein
LCIPGLLAHAKVPGSLSQFEDVVLVLGKLLKRSDHPVSELFEFCIRFLKIIIASRTRKSQNSPLPF